MQFEFNLYEWTMGLANIQYMDGPQALLTHLYEWTVALQTYLYEWTVSIAYTFITINRRPCKHIYMNGP